MVKNEAEGYYRIPDPDEKQDENSSREYWSSRAVKEDLPLEELYPQLDREGEEAYQDRLRMIREWRGEKVLHSVHQFDEAIPQPRDYYEKLFAKQVEIEGAQRDAGEARKKHHPKWPRDITKTPRVFSEQQSIAKYYIGSLGVPDQEQEYQKGFFEDAGAKRYTPEDKRFVAHKGGKFADSANDQELKALMVGGKMFEGFFYPLVMSGFFDLPSSSQSSSDTDIETKAAFIAPSKYDDYANGVDAAIILPMGNVDSANSSTGATYEPICFDLTTGIGKDKISRVKEGSAERHGLTNIKYPSTCLLKELPSVEGVPHFAICLPRYRLSGFLEHLAAEKPLPIEVADLINYQIYMQAGHWSDYWRKDTSSSLSSQRAKLFANIANHFGKKTMHGDDASRIEKIRKNPDNQDAIRFLSKILT